MEKIFQSLEVVIILIVIIIQIYIFTQNIKKIKKLETLFPLDLNNVLYINTHVMRIESRSSEISNEFSDILFQTNNYLQTKRDNSADYAILQDIAEKKSQTQEQDIQNSINTPLYVGLMATFLGVGVGLLQFVITTETISSNSISSFMGGVLIAMIGSFLGLILTVLANTSFNGALLKRDAHKEQYYDFVRRELLPVVNLSMGENLATLAGNLQTFNKEFSDNIGTFKGTIGNINQNITSQIQFLKRLEAIDIKKIANANIKIFEKIESVSDVFQKISDAYDRIDQHYKEADDAVDKFVKARTTELASLTELTSQSTNEFFDKWKKSITNQEQIFVDEMQGFFQSLTEEKTKFYTQLNTQANYLDFMEAVKPLTNIINEVKADTKKTKEIIHETLKQQAQSDNTNKILQAIVTLLAELKTTKNNTLIETKITKLKKWITFTSEIALIIMALIALGAVIIYIRITFYS